MRISEIPVPEVRPGWVLVKIQAIGLNHSEALLRMFEIENDYIRKPIVPGIECAGVVADAMEESRFSEGDWVIAMMGGMGRSFNGSYAEYALLPEQNVFWVNTTDRTEPWDWISLAAVPETYFTAYGSLTECLLLNDHDTLLVRGATSTVGQAAIQLGKAMDANVIAACRKEKDFDRLKAIGADVCVLDDGHLAESLPSEMRPKTRSWNSSGRPLCRIRSGASRSRAMSATRASSETSSPSSISTPSNTSPTACSSRASSAISRHRKSSIRCLN